MVESQQPAVFREILAVLSAIGICIAIEQLPADESV